MAAVQARTDYEEAVAQAAALLASDPVAAERLARSLSPRADVDPRLRLVIGSARRRLGDLAGARVILESLAKAYPRAAHTQYEFGLVLAAQGERAQAVSALRTATAVKCDLADAWRTLGDQLFLDGDGKGAEAAFAEHARASVVDPALRVAADAVFDGRLEEAERILRQRLGINPDHAEALQMLAEVFARGKRPADAQILLERCIELEPDLDGARFSYANVLFQQQKAVEAIPHLEQLRARDPDHPAYRNLQAACLGLVGEYEAANALYEGLLAEYGGQPRIWLNYGHALRTVGRRSEAIDAYKRCIALDPSLGDAYWSLANLKVASFSPEEEAVMVQQLARPDLAEEDRLHLNYALGKALEDRGDHAGSFARYADGAAIRRRQTRYDADETSAQTQRSRTLFSQPFLEARRGAGSSAPDPIFIVGLPRSGSTLVEQILASHSAVEGTMELPDIGFIAQGLGQPYPEVLKGLDACALKALGDAYLSTTRVHRKLGRPFFIDKMPNNFQHLGLIHLMLPNAKIVDARRHPLGSGFSAFKQHFAQGQNFSYDLGDVGRYYRDYVELLDHFDKVLPGRVHRVIYEDLVTDTEAEVRRLLGYCGLPFEAACLKFYENDRAVRTVSSEQVRRPIFRDGLDQWRRYEPWLGPLKEALGPTLETWRGARPG